MSVTYLDNQDFLKNLRLLEAERKVGKAWRAFDDAARQFDLKNARNYHLARLHQEWRQAQEERDQVWDPLA